jgi:LPXTG-motif cell wall-anchored protein
VRSSTTREALTLPRGLAGGAPAPAPPPAAPVSSGGRLPATGPSSAPLGAAGALLVVLGLAGAVSRRRAVRRA